MDAWREKASGGACAACSCRVLLNPLEKVEVACSKAVLAIVGRQAPTRLTTIGGVATARGRLRQRSPEGPPENGAVFWTENWLQNFEAAQWYIKLCAAIFGRENGPNFGGKN